MSPASRPPITLRRGIPALLLLSGGVSGLWLAGLILSTAPLSPMELIRTLGVAAYMAAGLTAGVLLWRGSRAGTWLAVAFLALQVPVLSAGWGRYWLAAPLGFAPLVGREGVGLLWETGAGWSIGGSGSAGVGLNLAALALLWAVLRARTGVGAT